MKTVHVAAAVITSGQKILAVQRGYGEFKGGWEFPGGKVEASETETEALKREIYEELRAEIEIQSHLCTVEYDYPSFHLSMACFLCHLKNGHFELLEHESARWLSIDELECVDWLPADIEVVEQLKKMMQQNAD